MIKKKKKKNKQRQMGSVTENTQESRRGSNVDARTAKQTHAEALETQRHRQQPPKKMHLNNFQDVYEAKMSRGPLKSLARVEGLFGESPSLSLPRGCLR